MNEPKAALTFSHNNAGTQPTVLVRQEQVSFDVG